MGLDYVIFHGIYTVPLAVILTILYGPFLIRREIYEIATLITIAVVATIPWDSYLIRNHIWSYASDSVIGYTLYSIPLEEVFFFAIQTYLASVLYCILTKPLVLPIYLRSSSESQSRRVRQLGQAFLVAAFAAGVALCHFAGELTYLGLILIWVSPVLLLQWSISCAFLIALPWKVTIIPVCIPTLYLWFADANAVSTGTWTIENGTKVGYQLWNGLELEEAVFFLVTNIMVVGGLVCMDCVFAIEEYRILCSKESSTNFSLKLALKSVSMFVGSALFQGSLRVDLIFLYHFCRVMDDLVDGDIAPDYDARYWITQCSQALDAKFNTPTDQQVTQTSDNPTISPRHQVLQSALDQLPLSKLSQKPLYDLLRGFEMDLDFNAHHGSFPIHTEADLDMYAYRVASTVATLVINLVYHYHSSESHRPSNDDQSHRERLTRAGIEMGKALQCVNIARDIGRDAAINRVYIPTSWLAEVGLTPEDVIRRPASKEMYVMQEKMLDYADVYYWNSRAAIEELPVCVRGPVRVTVESYMEIGRVLRATRTIRADGEKFRLSLWRRLAVAWAAMGDRPRKIG
ncbi:Lycopene beta-cyclase [Aspergillus steynii IBT 23096]|uniref:Bifunctional lycopene cyclase/phytoene synthase n=1 Tax=Aspergillus steynii IBT 23096 TaxID=1392250 RepID=A0A2I2GK21_9EURO|nr:Lycopene beta-cyclase [Aspergillus steynii IBT 23096]PLB53209.1 Lycopene beta-cyclase [Aspergillus steynii IBT 23096]